MWLNKDPKQNLKTLMPLFAPPLAVLEQHHVAHVGRFVTPPEQLEAVEAAQRIAELGAHRALRLAVPRPDETPSIFTGLSGSAGSDFDVLNRLVADCIERKLDKLTRAEADEHHLFVWVRHTGAWMAMTDLPPPPEAPAVPPTIDMVWAAAPNGLTRVGTLYRLVRSGRWEPCEVPPTFSAVGEPARNVTRLQSTGRP